MKPTTNRLLIKVDVKKAPKKGEELAAATSIMSGKVLAAGPEVKGVAVTDKVVFAPYGIDEVIVAGEKLLDLVESRFADDALVFARENLTLEPDTSDVNGIGKVTADVVFGELTAFTEFAGFCGPGFGEPASFVEVGGYFQE